jgi:hypothetical protein
LDTSERQRFSDVVGVCSPGVSSLHSGHATQSLKTIDKDNSKTS